MADRIRREERTLEHTRNPPSIPKSNPRGYTKVEGQDPVGPFTPRRSGCRSSRGCAGRPMFTRSQPRSRTAAVNGARRAFQRPRRQRVSAESALCARIGSPTHRDRPPRDEIRLIPLPPRSSSAPREAHSPRGGGHHQQEDQRRPAATTISRGALYEIRKKGPRKECADRHDKKNPAPVECAYAAASPNSRSRMICLDRIEAIPRHLAGIMQSPATMAGDDLDGYSAPARTPKFPEMFTCCSGRIKPPPTAL